MRVVAAAGSGRGGMKPSHRYRPPLPMVGCCSAMSVGGVQCGPSRTASSGHSTVFGDEGWVRRYSHGELLNRQHGRLFSSLVICEELVTTQLAAALFGLVPWWVVEHVCDQSSAVVTISCRRLFVVGCGHGELTSLLICLQQLSCGHSWLSSVWWDSGGFVAGVMLTSHVGL